LLRRQRALWTQHCADSTAVRDLAKVRNICPCDRDKCLSPMCLPSSDLGHQTVTVTAAFNAALIIPPDVN
jgi:hypothetical protein